ncbi:glycerol-3-phosphate acyltransferase 4 [Silurus meridionalis]|nr:glycerol-3-phosphate acyltransferase 4 [Silurus meridionalis]
MGPFVSPFDNLLCMLLGISFTVWFTLLLVFIVVPAIFGLSFGIRRLYMNALLKVFEWATMRIERGAKEKNHLVYKPYTNGIIAKEPTSLEQEFKEIRRVGSSRDLNDSSSSSFSFSSSPTGSSSSSSSSSSFSSSPTGSSPSTSEFAVSDVFYFCRRGIESIVDDEVTKRFTAEELESWNLLTRSNYNFRHISTRLTALWGLGLIIRYCILLPLRLTLAITGVTLLVVLTTLVGFLPSGSENKPKNGGICVANHTSPIDVLILASDGCYAMVGQIHGGLMGVIQRSMVKACPHIWFERSEVKDRHLVAKRLSNHVEDKSKLPILIFPEGTCINNTSVMMFKKGSFEIASTIYPVAIKYDPRFGDAFWNSSKFGMVNYLLHMMSSWAIVCSVWYLPPMKRQEDEDAVQFANRVKAAIARQGGLVDLLW